MRKLVNQAIEAEARVRAMFPDAQPNHYDKNDAGNYTVEITMAAVEDECLFNAGQKAWIKADELLAKLTTQRGD